MIVAIIDSGIDIEHEDLKGKIWVNEDEIAGNGIDDDNNGYVDDVIGYDFVSSAFPCNDADCSGQDNDPADVGAEKAGVEFVVLAGFMRILSPWFVSRYRGRLLNIHPALLPRFPGLDTHQRVLDAGDEWHGSTVHFVTEELDGGPRILQGRLRVNPGETADELQHRVQAIEHRIYPEAAGLVGSGRIAFRDGKTFLDDREVDEPIIRTYD